MTTENPKSSEATIPAPPLLDSFIPLGFLIILLAGSVYFFGEDSTAGATQVAFFFASGLAILAAVKNGHSWKEIETSITKGISVTINAILILFMVGAVIGSWIVSGTVPTLLYYGLKLIDPNIFYISTCIVCAFSALCIGSSWSVIGTIGLGLFGVANSLGISSEITAGAIISGAYFGDKMSPLSDTTNLAPAVAGTDLFTHIGNMIWTTIPAISIALVAFWYLGLDIEVKSSPNELNQKLEYLREFFNVGLHLLIPPLLVLILALMKFPAFLAMLLSSLSGIVIAVFFQKELLISFGTIENLSDMELIIKGVWTALFDGYSANTPDADLNNLLSRGGMADIRNNVWLVISAMMFGSIMEHAGFLQRLIKGMMSLARSTGSLIFTTVITCISVNIVAADQFISIVLPGRLYQLEYRKRKLGPQTLSRTLEDAGTVTSPLIPWNTCGVFISSVFDLTAFSYAPYCFFNLLCPIISIFYGVFNFKLTYTHQRETLTRTT
ncbi:Na+/H+ antiporter NhaC [Paremcibacter congregatus]|uniref:Na+/H+ antiporter NhaC n=1 Tax=Paremcibacter congregatus TaxID=2043170 RepID=UPI00195A683B|nr:Na+/H+ antiporter NhaC [Paremcibacter congregatus]